MSKVTNGRWTHDAAHIVRCQTWLMGRHKQEAAHKNRIVRSSRDVNVVLVSLWTDYEKGVCEGGSCAYIAASPGEPYTLLNPPAQHTTSDHRIPNADVHRIEAFRKRLKEWDMDARPRALTASSRSCVGSKEPSVRTSCLRILRFQMRAHTS